ncbi:MAG: hypothetical protein MUP22_16570 [Desulfobacterales bacterium]|nr:hypothetical protein [Desulfobacterales bacterium]
MKHPFGDLNIDQVKIRAKEIAPAVVTILIGAQNCLEEKKKDVKTKPAEISDSKKSDQINWWDDNKIQVNDSLEDINELFMKNKWSDGLPIIPPTQTRVKKMLESSGRTADDLIASIPPIWGKATVAKIAANAVMSGCNPQHMPLLITAVEAMVETVFNLQALQATTNPCAPLMLVNGPVRQKLGINYGAGVLGPGFKANAVIGRAIRLILLNIGGAQPGELDKATHGQPGKFSFCIAENEEENPWEPFHVENGYKKDASTVTMINATGTLNILDSASSTAESLLKTLAGGMISQGTINLLKGGDPLLILSPEHAHILAREGVSKQGLKKYLFEKARLPIFAFSEENQEKYLKKRRPHLFENIPYEQITVSIADQPDDIMIVVSGGSGRHSVFVPTFVNGRTVTKEVR